MTLDEKFESAPATSADVIRFAWQKYAASEFDD